MGLEEEIDDLRAEIRETPYNKSTEEHIGRLKAKLAAKKERLENQSSEGGGHGYAIEKTGDASVALVGVPSVGKSTLLNALTNADSEVGAYEFTTIAVHPGMLQYRGANIQLLDVPGLIEGAAHGRGRGREVLSVVRTADLVVFLLSPFEIDQYDRLHEELAANKIRLDADPPDMRLSKTGHGGISITSSVEQPLETATIEEVIREHGVTNATVTLREPLDIDRLVDGLMDNRVYRPSLVAVNKIDLVEGEYRETVRSDLRSHDLDPDEVLFVSAERGDGLDELKAAIWDALGLIRIYLDKPGTGPDYDEPLILRTDQTVADACEKIGGEVADRFRFARVSGPSAKHDDQQVGPDHALADEDVLRVITRR